MPKYVAFVPDQVFAELDFAAVQGKDSQALSLGPSNSASQQSKVDHTIQQARDALLLCVCHGLTCADRSCRLSLGLHLFLSYLTSPSLCTALISDDSRTCDEPSSMAFHDVPFLGQVY
jgi:hypothetical protein